MLSRSQINIDVFCVLKKKSTIRFFHLTLGFLAQRHTGHYCNELPGCSRGPRVKGEWREYPNKPTEPHSFLLCPNHCAFSPWNTRTIRNCWINHLGSLCRSATKTAPFSHAFLISPTHERFLEILQSQKYNPTTYNKTKYACLDFFGSISNFERAI